MIGFFVRVLRTVRIFERGFRVAVSVSDTRNCRVFLKNYIAFGFRAFGYIAFGFRAFGYITDMF